MRTALLAALTAASLCAATTAPASPAQDYMLYCMGCHGSEAQGVAGKVPPLAHALGNYMRSEAGRDYLLRVPGAANSVLSDAQLAEVLNWLARQYCSQELRADVPFFTTAEVAAHRRIPLAAVLEARSKVIHQLAATGDAPAEAY